MAIVEVDLTSQTILKWDPLTDFDNRNEFQPNKMYNFGDLNKYLKESFCSKGFTQMGGLVMCFNSSNILLLLGTIKKLDKVNSNNCELNFMFYLNFSNMEWSGVIKSEIHNFEESGQIMKHSKVYLSSGIYFN